jgi:hypothetical protein
MAIGLQSKMLITKSNLPRKRKRAFKPFIFLNSFIDDVGADEFCDQSIMHSKKGLSPYCMLEPRTKT